MVHIKNKFDISDGNLEVLKTIPEMMNDPKWREELRRLVLNYKTSQILKSKHHTGLKQSINRI